MAGDNSTKKRIRETALALFQERSFEEVTLNEICEKSGVNKHTFYYYFKSKDDLLDQYYDIPYQFKTRDLSTILAADSYVEQFWLLNRHMIDYVENSGPAIVGQILIKNLSADVGTFKISEEKKEGLALGKQILERGQACGQFRNQADSAYLVLLFFQIAMSSALFWSMHNGVFSYVDLVRYSYEMAFDVAPELRKMKDFKIPHHLF